MATIPFIHSVFFPSNQTADQLEQRFTKHLRLLRCGLVALSRSGVEMPEADTNELLEIRITILDRIRIHNRVSTLVKRRQEASGMRHLTQDERERLAVLADGVRLAEVPTEHRADEIAAALHDEMPWMGPATEQLWKAT